MKIQYLGHASFRLISDLGTTIVCDPYNGEMVGFDMARVRCDVVTVSHHHDDHDCMDNIIGSPAVIDCEGQCCADDVAITSVITYHDDAKGSKRGKTLVFCFLIDGLKVVHMGDVGFFDEKIVERIVNCDVLLLPVGGVFTVDAVCAKKYVDSANPKIVIPMHYKSDGHCFQIDGVNKFTDMFSKCDVEYSVNDSMTLSDTPHNEKTRIVVLQKFE